MTNQPSKALSLVKGNVQEWLWQSIDAVGMATFRAEGTVVKLSNASKDRFAVIVLAENAGCVGVD